METLIEQIIGDFQARELPQITLRRTQIPSINGKIDAVIGMRRSGKTYFLYQNIKELLEKGIPKNQILYINFDDERLSMMKATDLTVITDTYFRLWPKLKDVTCYLFFDEIQNVPGWEKYLRRLIDTEKVKIAVTGSSSKLLSREIATSLRGRSLSTEIFPFSFREALAHAGIHLKTGQAVGAKKRSLLQNRMRRYLETGGFPEVQALNDDYRLRVLRDYVDVAVLRDIVERHSVSSVLPLRLLVRALLGGPATMFSVNKFFNDLKSQGVACGKNSMHEYLDHVTDAYLAFLVPIHSRSERVTRVNPKKVYSIDTGISRAFAHYAGQDLGHVLENFVFVHLRRQGLGLEYYRTREGWEVDFISTSTDGRSELYQVCSNLEDEETRNRELRALVSAMNELGISESTLVTLEKEEKLKIDNKRINVVPAWSWALNSSSV